MARKLVLILGPHRTGTSTCAAAVAALGADTGLLENPASHENKKGFFEHTSLILLNEEILQNLGGSWDNPSFHYPENPPQTPEFEALKQRAEELIFSLFPTPSFIVLKEPRLCQLLPFWLDIFHRCGWKNEEIHCIQTLRHPVEAALSQQKRVISTPDFYEFGRELEEGAGLWFSLSIQSLKNSSHLKNLCISYADLVQNPKATLAHIATFLHITPDPDAIHQFTSHFVESGLYRNSITPEAQAQIQQSLPEIFPLFEALNQLKNQPLSQEQTQQIVARFYCEPLLRKIDYWTIRAASRLSYLARNRGFFLKEQEQEKQEQEKKGLSLLKSIFTKKNLF